MPTVLILGASSEMGFEIARKFAIQKFDVQLAGRQPDQIRPLQSDLQIRYGVHCTVHAFDAMDMASHNSFYQSLPAKPDVTACIVGYMNDNEKVIADQAETIRTINTNFTGPVSILNIIAADYATRKSGTIIGISSVAGLRGRQSNYIYGSAKAGFTAYLSGLRNKLYHDGVHVVTVLPGFVNTKMTAHLALPPLLTAQPQQVADAVYKAYLKKKNVIYVKWFWKWIMLIITSIPESMFKKKKL
ncbi:MAG: SDR family oxidoreductase [Chitinophagaceae bacterium]|nr:MAG: SDR family oxidoreductase [Chitinophagaceae bacterium]